MLNSEGKSLEALQYARKHFIKFCEEDIDDLQRDTVMELMGLLGYP
jgi:hypothetical protein